MTTALRGGMAVLWAGAATAVLGLSAAPAAGLASPGPHAAVEQCLQGRAAAGSPAWEVAQVRAGHSTRAGGPEPPRVAADRDGAAAGAAEAPLDPPFPEEVRALLGRLDDPDPAARSDAIQRLRLLARRADIAGAKRQRRGGEFAPEVAGLVPHLVRAAGDEAEANRLSALFALADTLDPAAAPALRERLADESAAVRFTAACLLTEFRDASGLPELKAALARLRARPGSAGPSDAERLLASLERITGKGFGEVPDSPALASDSRVAAASEARIRELLDAWAAWWAWEPGE